MSKVIRDLSILIFVALTTPTIASAQGTTLQPNCNGDKCYGSLTAVPTLFANILAVVTVVAAFAAFAMLIFGGFRFIIAQGDPKAVQAARGTLTWAVVGLVMIVVSWLILVFISQFFGINLTQFCFGVKEDGSACF